MTNVSDREAGVKTPSEDRRSRWGTARIALLFSFLGAIALPSCNATPISLPGAEDNDHETGGGARGEDSGMASDAAASEPDAVPTPDGSAQAEADAHVDGRPDADAGRLDAANGGDAGPSDSGPDALVPQPDGAQPDGGPDDAGGLQDAERSQDAEGV